MSERILAIEVINSMWHDHLGTRSEDRLDMPGWRESFLRDWDAPVLEPGLEQLEQLKRLRTLLREMSDLQAAGEAIADEQLEALNGWFARAQRRKELTRKGGEYAWTDKPAEENWDAFLSEAALSFASLLADGRIKRVKTCRNSVCKWVFYDDTKNGKRQWCSSDICGNVARVRRHRDKD